MAGKKRVVKKMLLGLYAPHADYLERASDDGLEVTEIVRNLIIEWGEKRYPREKDYARAAKIRADLKIKEVSKKDYIKTVSNEEYAEKILCGQIRWDGSVAFRIGGGREVYFPLATIKEKTRENTPEIDIHWQLLDRTFKYGGRDLDKSEWEEIWEGWDQKRPNFFSLQQMGLWPAEKYWTWVESQRGGNVPSRGLYEPTESVSNPEDLVELDV